MLELVPLCPKSVENTEYLKKSTSKLTMQCLFTNTLLRGGFFFFFSRDAFPHWACVEGHFPLFI